jgi:type IV pilus assembly protein PilO|tara:strand:- start:801 stop:1394 length:594 start_codon:yes stop_codon:yes gene_type:complete
MTLAELNNLSFDNIGSWPVVVKIVFILIVCSGILGLAYWKDINPLREDLAKAQVEETELKVTFEGRQKKAANLNALKQQLEDIKETFGDLLKRLPNKTEVAALLVDISQQGLGAGLEFELFKPGSERPTDFYVELPINITVVGDYHEFGNFISGVSDLPRIVTNHDVRIRPQGEGRLVMQTVAKTYRYMDEEEEAGQ